MTDVPQRLARLRQQRRSHDIDVVELDQLPLLALEGRDLTPRERFERPDISRARTSRAPGHAPLLAPIAGQKDHDPIGFPQLVGPQDRARRTCTRLGEF